MTEQHDPNDETTARKPLLTQRRWRIVGGVCLGGAACMAWYGLHWTELRETLWMFAAYWGVFTVLLLTSVYMAMLDLRYIRVDYFTAERDVFLDTLGDETLRRALREAQAEKAGQDGSERPED
ncbi:MAG: hypothetical protein GY851_32190 [bacterium]|nr:hypothetical protein [bacterium]